MAWALELGGSAGLTSGTNLYVYVSNNPVIYRDPDGRAEKGWWDTTISGVNAANKAIHDASLDVGNQIIDQNEAEIARTGMKNEYVIGSLRFVAAIEATVVSTALEVGAGILMAGPNMSRRPRRRRQ